jgi:predicted amidophosphoribosyltransferase
LICRGATPSQTGLSPAGRLANGAGAFAVNPARRDRTRGQRVVLIDDVVTTGTTVAPCARRLLHAGIAEVSVLTRARVVTPAIEPI